MSNIHIKIFTAFLHLMMNHTKRDVNVKINGNTIEKIGPNLPQDEEYDSVE